MDEQSEKEKVVVEVVRNGPARVIGNFVYRDGDGNEEEREGRMSICRCGLSQKMPFCDGAHKGNEFE